MSIEEEAKEVAQRFIDTIKDAKDIDFQPHFDIIAQHIKDYVFNGMWDTTIDVEDPHFPDIRVIEETEYDQHMDEDDENTPSWDDVIECGGHYLVLE